MPLPLFGVAAVRVCTGCKVFQPLILEAIPKDPGWFCENEFAKGWTGGCARKFEGGLDHDVVGDSAGVMEEN